MLWRVDGAACGWPALRGPNTPRTPYPAVDVPRLRPDAFVHFKDPRAAARAMEVLQGVVLPQLTGSKALTLAYSRSKRPSIAKIAMGGGA